MAVLMCSLTLLDHYVNVCAIMYSPFELFCILVPFVYEKGILVIYDVLWYLDLKLDSCSYYDM